jgi:L-lactate dehydrogenase complex protein LldE
MKSPGNRKGVKERRAMVTDAKGRTVTLFVQCLVDALYPEVAESMVRVLERIGLKVVCPVDQTCCGQAAFNTGYRRDAAVAARHFVEVFEKAETVVCPSGSCVDMVRHHYRELFCDDPVWLERAERIGRRTFEFTQFLVDEIGRLDLGSRFIGRVTYHDSCHLLRGLGVKDQPRKLLERVQGLTLVEMKDSDRCCGFGGTFSVKYPEISAAMAEQKVENILASGADTVTGCDTGCLMNIEGIVHRRGLPLRVLHIAQILAGQAGG